MSVIITGLNRRAVKYIIEITKNQFQELDKNNINGTMHRKQCMKQISICVWKLSVCLVQLTRFTGGYIWDIHFHGAYITCLQNLLSIVIYITFLSFWGRVDGKYKTSISCASESSCRPLINQG